MRSLQFGLVCPQTAWSALVEAGEQAERLGFDSLWVIDHIVPPTDPSRPCLEAWTALAGLATHTRRVRLGTLTTNQLFRNPVLLAKQAATVDLMSNGRLELGLGSGNAAPSYAMMGIEPATAKERMDRLQESVAIVDQLLRGEVVSFRGQYYQTTAAELRPPALQKPRPPIVLGAHRRASLRLAAAYADKWNTFLGFGLSTGEALARTRQRTEQLDQFCAELGRPPRALVRSVLAGFTQDRPWASCDAFEDFVARYRAIGITEFIFRWPASEQLETFARVAHEVIPRLRGGAAA
jgi:alkanesulfonate monooxygenase SsuD/methylene tetrahydromethanopterin reductase-like flavin-dependent oxidoreductase (luciferase family)